MSTGAVRAKVNYQSEPNALIPFLLDKAEDKSFVKEYKKLNKPQIPATLTFSSNQNFNINISKASYPKTIQGGVALQKFNNIVLRIDGLDPIPLLATYPIPENFEKLSNIEINFNLIDNVTRDVYRMFGDNDFDVSIEIPWLPTMRLSKESGIGSKYIPGYVRDIQLDPNDLPNATLEIPNSKWFPILGFIWKISENGSILESKDCGAFPKIKLEFAEKNFFKLKTLKNWTFSVANDSVQAHILYTRLLYLVIKEGILNINFFGVLTLNITFAEFRVEEMEGLLFLSNVYRKLKFLQIVFNCKFRFKELFDQDVLLTECLFRGAVEGKFSLRGGDVVFPNMKLSRREVTLPPFTAPTSVGMLLPNAKGELLSASISLGSVKCFLESAEFDVIEPDLKQESIIDKVFKEPDKFYDVNFFVLDNQIQYEFEDYLHSEKQIEIQKLLNNFREKLKKEEPIELADLLIKSLVGTVGEIEAENIAMGWLLHHRFSSLFVAGEARLKEGEAVWRVPILWEPKPGISIEVGEIFVDSNNGSIIGHSEIQKITAKTIEASMALPEADSFKYSYYREYNHRAILVVKNIIDDSTGDDVEVVIPSWDPEKIVRFSKSNIEDCELASSIKPGMYLTAQAQMLAENPKDLLLKNFLPLSETKPKLYLSSL